MKATDIVTFFLNNPPFEIEDTTKYTEMLKFISDSTLVELSENDPILDELTFITNPPVLDGDTSVIFDLDSIDPRFMEVVALEPTNSFAQSIEYAYASIYTYGSRHVVTRNAVQRAMNEASVISFLAINDALHIIDQWYSTKVRKLIYRGSQIKLKPDTEYYVLYRKYKTLNDLRQTDIKTFKALFEINLHLQIYQSDTFSAEGGLRSVSLSGLSVSFNVPNADTIAKTLRQQKSKILSSMAIDYDDIGLI